MTTSRNQFARTIGLAMLAYSVVSTCGSTCAQRSAAATGTAKLYANAREAFVEILADGHMAGSGAFLEKQGYVITAAHVLARPGRRLQVLSPVYGRLKAELVGVDIGHDLALLKVTPRDGGYAALPIAKATPDVGTECYLLGTPLYRHALLLAGKVARQRAGFEFMGYSKSYAEVYYIAGPSPPGTSGGVWLNAQGEVVGVQSMLMSVTNSAHGISFVVPPGAIARLLAAKRSASTASLNAAVEEIWQHAGGVRKKFADDARGVFIRSSRKDGPVPRAGLKEWDLIQAIDGKPVERAEQLLKFVREKRPGVPVKLEVLAPEAEKPRSVTASLVELEEVWSTKQPARKSPRKSDDETLAPATKTRA